MWGRKPAVSNPFEHHHTAPLAAAQAPAPQSGPLQHHMMQQPICSIADDRELPPTGAIIMPVAIFRCLMQGDRATKFAGWLDTIPIHAVITMDNQLVQDAAGAHLRWMSSGRLYSTCFVNGMSITALRRAHPGARTVRWDLLEAGIYEVQEPHAPAAGSNNTVKPAKIAIHMISTTATSAASAAAPAQQHDEGFGSEGNGAIPTNDAATQQRGHAQDPGHGTHATPAVGVPDAADQV